MQAVLRLNRPAIAERIASAADYLGIADGFDGFHAFVGEMNAALGIPGSLALLGVVEPDVDALVDAALRDPSCGGNPVELTRENLTTLLRECLEGS